MDTCPVVMFTLDKYGKIEMINKAYQKMINHDEVSSSVVGNYFDKYVMKNEVKRL